MTGISTIPIAATILYFGTPVVLLTTQNDDGSPNLAPMSSAWALGQTIVLGLGLDGQSGYNLRQRPEVAISVPGPRLWRHVERLAGVTGRYPVPETKPAGCRFVADKFGEAKLTPQDSDLIAPPRVAECGLQFEARAVRVEPDSTKDFLIVEAEVLKVHADPAIVVPGTDHVDPGAWNPLIYNFRHYFGLGPELGHTYRSQTPR
ncbi:MAG: flavin reductase family protein [Catenulispora sp.]|nr:flavin reductase family protein [Catenulispora sp.]